jgi:hypothetical protein
MHNEKAQYQAVLKKTEKIQALWRGATIRARLRNQDASGVKIQAAWRGRRDRAKFYQAKENVVYLQAVMRGHMTRKTLATERASATKIQSQVRRHQTQKLYTNDLPPVNERSDTSEDILEPADTQACHTDQEQDSTPMSQSPLTSMWSTAVVDESTVEVVEAAIVAVVEAVSALVSYDVDLKPKDAMMMPDLVARDLSMLSSVDVTNVADGGAARVFAEPEVLETVPCEVDVVEVVDGITGSVTESVDMSRDVDVNPEVVITVPDLVPNVAIEPFSISTVVEVGAAVPSGVHDVIGVTTMVSDAMVDRASNLLSSAGAAKENVAPMRVESDELEFVANAVGIVEAGAEAFLAAALICESAVASSAMVVDGDVATAVADLVSKGPTELLSSTDGAYESTSPVWEVVGSMSRDVDEVEVVEAVTEAVVEAASITDSVVESSEITVDEDVAVVVSDLVSEVPAEAS